MKITDKITTIFRDESYIHCYEFEERIILRTTWKIKDKEYGLETEYVDEIDLFDALKEHEEFVESNIKKLKMKMKTITLKINADPQYPNVQYIRYNNKLYKLEEE